MFNPQHACTRGRRYSDCPSFCHKTNSGFRRQRPPKVRNKHPISPFNVPDFFVSNFFFFFFFFTEKASCFLAILWSYAIVSNAPLPIVMLYSLEQIFPPCGSFASYSRRFTKVLELEFPIETTGLVSVSCMFNYSQEDRITSTVPWHKLCTYQLAWATSWHYSLFIWSL